jgi:hypothetical protein
MPTTKTDIKEATKTELQKRVNASVSEYARVCDDALWKMADQMQLITQLHGYSRKDAEQMFREGFCKHYKISWDGRSKDEHYESFRVSVARIGLVGNMPVKLYNELRNSGKSFTTVWAELTGDGGKLNKKLADMEKKKEDLSKATLLKEAEEGIGNAEEIAETTVEKPMKHKNNGNREKQEAWIVPEARGGYDIDEEWISQGRKIIKNDPKKFVRLIEQCVKFNLLSRRLLNMIEEELAERLSY